jgi:hypothetical protein
VKSRRFLAILTIGAFCFALSAFAHARAAQGPAILGVMLGTWNCSSQGSNGKSASSVTFTRVSDDLTQYTLAVTSGKNAGHKDAGVWYYDAKKGEFVSLGAGGYGWGVSRGPASADAMSVTFTDTYPSDPSNGTTTFRFNPGNITVTSDWKMQGKPMHSQGVCTKS